MQKWIARFRGINVGGKNILPMSELRSDLEGMGLENIRTYIQSDNVVFDSESSRTSRVRRNKKTPCRFLPGVFEVVAIQLLNPSA